MRLCSLIVNWAGLPWEAVPRIGEADNPGPVVYFDDPETRNYLEDWWGPLPGDWQWLPPEHQEQDEFNQCDGSAGCEPSTSAATTTQQQQ